MKEKVALIGAGDLGVLLAHHFAAKPDRYEVVGAFDDFQEKGSRVRGLDILGGVNDIRQSSERKLFSSLVMAIGYRHLAFRAGLYLRLVEMGLSFARYVHPHAYVDRGADLAPGSIVFPGCTIDHRCRIGPNSLLNTGCVLAHDVMLDGHTFFGPGVKSAGFVRIGAYSFIGVGTVIIDNIELGERCQTAGGAVVTKSFGDNLLLAGVPAQIKRKLDSVEDDEPDLFRSHA
ncbi:PglD-N domain-containing protein [Sulfidibacter corallicola]|uniref:Sugar O-acyltransferase, sialic acid O-acetyltransferase NeuD family n=1 Tax=Sulfidibacter corallicola TaxID=2818388 RepID=A0A8A4TYZ1_SULCO|nr:hypothetical protein [Sulfidibacter corallicola]QTD54314.1 hypothetical protein J3U87_17860 [Sulfidibacter corallicola]